MQENNQYRELQSLVYKILYPEGIPLEFGCEIEKDGEIFLLALENDTGVFSETLKGYWHTVNREGQAVALQKNVRTTVLGKPLSIADVLRALEKKSIATYEINAVGQLRKYCRSSKEKNGEHCSCYEVSPLRPQIQINLALPLSAPENSEACETLNNLLK